MSVIVPVEHGVFEVPVHMREKLAIPPRGTILWHRGDRRLAISRHPGTRRGRGLRRGPILVPLRLRSGPADTAAVRSPRTAARGEPGGGAARCGDAAKNVR